MENNGKKFTKRVGEKYKMKKTTFTNRILSVLVIASTLLLTVGCDNKNNIEQPDIPMKTVSQNSKSDLATFEFEIPNDWISGPKYELSVIAAPSKYESESFKDIKEELSNSIQIQNYDYDGLRFSKTNEDIYIDLFDGKTESYKNYLNQSFENAQNSNLGNGESLFDFLQPLVPDNNESENTPKQYIKDITCNHYQGKSGKITEVQYSFLYGDEEIRVIECYCQDIPYMVSGMFNDSMEISSGDIALWVAGSLKVTENFVIEDDVIKKKET